MLQAAQEEPRHLVERLRQVVGGGIVAGHSPSCSLVPRRRVGVTGSVAVARLHPALNPLPVGSTTARSFLHHGSLPPSRVFLATLANPWPFVNVYLNMSKVI